MAWTISSNCCWTGLVFSNHSNTFVMLQFDWTLIPAFVVIVAGSVIGTLGFGSFSLQCNLDYPDSFVSPKNCRCEIVRITKIKRRPFKRWHKFSDSSSLVCTSMVSSWFAVVKQNNWISGLQNISSTNASSSVTVNYIHHL